MYIYYICYIYTIYIWTDLICIYIIYNACLSKMTNKVDI